MKTTKNVVAVLAWVFVACCASAQQVHIGLSPNVPSWVELIAREGARLQVSFGLQKAFGGGVVTPEALRQMHADAFWLSARKACFSDKKSGSVKTFNPLFFMRIESRQQRLQRAAAAGNLFHSYNVAASRPEDLGGLSEKTIVFLETFFRARRPELVRPQSSFLLHGNVILRFAFEDGRPEKYVQITLMPSVLTAYVCVNDCAFSFADAKKLG